MPAADPLLLEPVQALSGTVRLPGSKSISNRALLLAALAKGETRLQNLLDSDDTLRMRSALTALGVALRTDAAETIVTGLGAPLPRPNAPVSLDLGLAGTAIRPLAAALTLGEGQFTLDGNARMRERPIGHLVDALRPLGADISYTMAPGYPPLRIAAHGLAGGATRIRGDISSQFLTALLLAAPYAESPVRIEIDGELVSTPYIDITLNMMARFGVTVGVDAYRQFNVPKARYRSPGQYLVEGDASSASYFLAAGAISGAGITVEGIGLESIQGDVAFAEVLEAMGATVRREADRIHVNPPSEGKLKAIDLDLNHIPDAAMTAAVLALFADGTSVIRNIANWRVKETDRLFAMATELRKLGASVEEHPDAISVTPPAVLRPARVATYGDHRMAMCFSLAALAGVPIEIEDPECVAKTFPDYFAQFEQLARRS